MTQKLVELYVRELTKEGATLTIADVPARLRDKVQAALDALPNTPGTEAK